MKNSEVADAPGRSRWSGILGWLGTLAISVAFAGIVIWSGLAFNIVATDSMVPTLDPTDMVVTVGPNVIEPEIGSVVVFTATLFGNDIPPHVHRIIGVEPNGDWITKGDNAVKPDPWRVKPQDVTGVMIGAVPTQLIRNPVLLGAGLFAMLVLLFWPRNGKDDEPDKDGETAEASSDPEVAVTSANPGPDLSPDLPPDLPAEGAPRNPSDS